MAQVNKAFDYAFASPWFVGFDQLFDDLNQTVALKQSAYPFHNIKKVNDNNYVIELALAGFKENEIDITTENKKIIISGKKETPTDEYIYLGITNRGFVKTFTLSEDVIAKSAAFEYGILSISLERIVPEELKPKRIPITIGSQGKQFLTEETNTS